MTHCCCELYLCTTNWRHSFFSNGQSIKLLLFFFCKFEMDWPVLLRKLPIHVFLSGHCITCDLWTIVLKLHFHSRHVSTKRKLLNKISHTITKKMQISKKKRHVSTRYWNSSACRSRLEHEHPHLAKTVRPQTFPAHLLNFFFGALVHFRSHLEINANPQQISHLAGYIQVSEWCRAMEAATGLGLPWRMLRDKLVALDPDTQLVRYATTFDKLSDNNKSVSIADGSVRRVWQIEGIVCNHKTCVCMQIESWRSSFTNLKSWLIE